MLRPSYAELMDILNKGSEEGDEITSRYTIVIAAAKRARQLIDGDEPMVKEISGKPVSTAVEELREGKIKIVPEGQGTVLNLKKKENLHEEISKELSYVSGEPIFDSTTVEMVSHNDDKNEENDEFEENTISDSMIEEEGEF